MISSYLRQVLSWLSWVPPRCRYNPESPPHFSMALNILFTLAATFTIASQYYNHPILNKMAEDFGVSDERVTAVPTLMQAGYSLGLLFLCPLGDIFKRRQYILLLILISAVLWIPLCVTKSFRTFCVFSFLSSVTSVTPQLMMPLVASLAPPHRRATYLSIVVSGLLFGVLIARILSGIVTQYTGWRNIYWVSLGIQYLLVAQLWLFMPDYPSVNPDGINYFKLLWSILRLLFHEPLLLQACLVGLLTFAIFTSFWTTLTFLLASSPYYFSSISIGLFALIGIAGMAFGPVFARYVTDRIAPLFSIIAGELTCLIGIAVGTFIGKFSIWGPVVEAFSIDLGLQMSQIAQRSSIYSIDPNSRNRINTAYMVALTIGQLIGTAVGNHGYAKGGWIESGNINLGFVLFGIFVCCIRGPWEKGWVGWSGGWGLQKSTILEVSGSIEAMREVSVTNSEVIEAARDESRENTC
ncbi:major facilitator superfamily domain-containing protein [Halenospora varia]|nr:major facilitator superfamily domain-containing protein [Halenospora varia]